MERTVKVVVTGGAGFIGSALVRYLIGETDFAVINLDKLTYAADLASLDEASCHPRYRFEQTDICDSAALDRLFARHRPDAVMHLAAESHVDRSIDGPAAFIQSNIVGTYTLLEAVRRYWMALEGRRRAAFRFHHVSTDEVYGTLGAAGKFTEETPYQPNSPYSASKAAADHLARAWNKTYGLPVVISNCTNNYGPRQFPEKLIPLTILNAVAGERLPIYGTGENVRDWLHVEDHAEALHLILRHGRIGEKYNVSGDCERSNIAVVRQICAILDELLPNSPHRPHEHLIHFVTDRPGHDERYAMDATKLRRELGWAPRHTFEIGLRQTVRWYLKNPNWTNRIRTERYRGERLGLGERPHADMAFPVA